MGWFDDLKKEVVWCRVPIIWAASIITRARKEGRIRDDFAVKTLIDELNVIRGKCGLLLAYDNISVPLVYTQVVSGILKWGCARSANFFRYLPQEKYINNIKEICAEAVVAYKQFYGKMFD